MKFRIDKKSHYYIIGKGIEYKFLFKDVMKLIESNPDHIIYKASQKYRKITIEEFIENPTSVIILIHKKYESDVNEIINIVSPVLKKYLTAINPIYIYKNIEIRDEI